jgi:hypothetical protein
VQGEPLSGVLYEGTAAQPGAYLRFDLGVGFLLRDGKIGTIFLGPPHAPRAAVAARELPRFDPNSNNPFQVDVRGADLSHLDLRDRIADLNEALFDTGTVWRGAGAGPCPTWPACTRWPRR